MRSASAVGIWRYGERPSPMHTAAAENMSVK